MFHTQLIVLKRTPIFYRIAIGSALIIVLSGIIGTILTHFLTNISATLWHYVIFSSIGVLISLALDFIIIRLSLQPLRELRQVVNHIQAGQAEVEQLDREDTDPDIYRLTRAINSLISQLQKSNHQLRILSERAINAQEEERKRIARSLHDDTGQALSTLIISIDRLEKLLPQDDDHLISQLGSIRQLAAESLTCLRNIIYDLRPAILDDLGLLPAIRWYAQTNLEGAGIKVELDFDSAFPTLSPPLATTLFRVLQEGVSNVIRHSKAKTVTIALGAQDNQVYLRINDDGHGFDSTQNASESPDMQHWGLVGIQERIELVGGGMSITSDPSHGTTLQVTAPLVRLAESAYG